MDISERLQKIALGTQKLSIIEIYTNYKGTHPQPKSFCSYSFDILTLYNLLQRKSTTKSIFWSISDKYNLSLFLPCTGFQSRMKSRLWSQRENADNNYIWTRGKMRTKNYIVSLVFVFNLNGRLARNEDIVSPTAKPHNLSNARHIHRKRIKTI